ncbi:hypothetical protein McanCB56680_001055 [Microsporum canis]|uniref:Uncharacterized protein n=1 Tax=Arthroderma otae (strain ATCC MYA-4605 / CBS 113480) TaxID=554155 RepID=C5FK04_ARTOC|nr:uncharacterized protein MCYG_02845 [Microsporum canis CBS 113480]EEQ30026.1 predicted protein [Microsporum canis CBS 113480]
MVAFALPSWLALCWRPLSEPDESWPPGKQPLPMQPYSSPEPLQAVTRPPPPWPSTSRRNLAAFHSQHSSRAQVERHSPPIEKVFEPTRPVPRDRVLAEAHAPTPRAHREFDLSTGAERGRVNPKEWSAFPREVQGGPTRKTAHSNAEDGAHHSFMDLRSPWEERWDKWQSFFSKLLPFPSKTKSRDNLT